MKLTGYQTSLIEYIKVFVQKRILPTFSVFKQLLFDIVFPAMEKTLSAAVDIAETHNMDLASLLMLGSLGSFISITQIHLVLYPVG